MASSRACLSHTGSIRVSQSQETLPKLLGWWIERVQQAFCDSPSSPSPAPHGGWLLLWMTTVLEPSVTASPGYLLPATVSSLLLTTIPIGSFLCLVWGWLLLGESPSYSDKVRVWIWSSRPWPLFAYPVLLEMQEVTAMVWWKRKRIQLAGLPYLTCISHGDF